MNNSADVKLTSDSINVSWKNSHHYCWEYCMEQHVKATCIESKCRQCCQGSTGVLKGHNMNNRLERAVLYCLHCEPAHCGLQSAPWELPVYPACISLHFFVCWHNTDEVVLPEHRWQLLQLMSLPKHWWVYGNSESSSSLFALVSGVF